MSIQILHLSFFRFFPKSSVTTLATLDFFMHDFLNISSKLSIATHAYIHSVKNPVKYFCNLYLCHIIYLLKLRVNTSLSVLYSVIKISKVSSCNYSPPKLDFHNCINQLLSLISIVNYFGN